MDVEVQTGTLDETVQVETGPPLGAVDGPYAKELYGVPVGINHQGSIAKPVTVTWHVQSLSQVQRDTLSIVHWDEAQGVWESLATPVTWEGDSVTAQITDFSFVTWLSNSGVEKREQKIGEWIGSREGAPDCNGKDLPGWVRNSVSPSETTDAAALQVCFEPDKDDRVTVRIGNNRPFSQFVDVDGIPKWAWTWTGSEDYGVPGAVFSVAHSFFDSDTRFFLPPLHEQAVGVARPPSSGAAVVTGNFRVDGLTVLVDATAFALDQVSIGGTSNPVLNAYLQASYECAAGKELLANATDLKLEQVIPGVVKTAAGCAKELDNPDSELSRKYKALVDQSVTAGGIKQSSATQADRAVKLLAKFAKVLTVAQLSSYFSDHLANMAVGNLAWSLLVNGTPPNLGSWSPSCSDLKADSNSLYRNLALQDDFSDKSRELWQFSQWDAYAGRAVAPLVKSCNAAYLEQLSAYLPTSWQDTKAATIVAEKLTKGATIPLDDARVSFVTPFQSDGRIRLPLSTQDATAESGDSCRPSPLSPFAGTYLCGSTAANLTGCWPVDDMMYCMHGPVDGTVTPIYVGNQTLDAAASENPEPWEVILSDGSRCSPRIGGAWDAPPNGFNYTYSCDGDYVALLAPESRTTVQVDGPTWRVNAQRDWSGAVETAEVTGVVFPGQAPDVPPAQTGDACPSASDLQAALGADETLAPDLGLGIQCVNDWATAGYRTGTYGNYGLFRKDANGWMRVRESGVCTIPSPIPVRLYRVCQAG